MDIGKRIQARREELGMTQSELAEKVGYTSKSTIARIEGGSNQLKQTMIVKFAKALDTTPAYLIGWDDIQVTTDHTHLITMYLAQLNDAGYQEVIKRLEELTQLSKYRKE